MNQITDSRKEESNGHRVKKAFFSVIKRFADIILSGVALLFLVPVFIVIAIAIKLEDGGSIIYSHNRVGKYGRPIRVFKFRTMRMRAERLEDCLRPEQLEEYQREFKLTDDPRVTRIGGFLRVTSMDEFPQFFNVLKGDMSLVGPRPLVRDELMSKYTETEREALLSVKPGLTGLWQVNGRSNCTYQNGQRQKMELSYIEQRSLWLDIKILIRTVFAVLLREGAR
jgi:lipopolysaccharide/colanic/teichoic acid biosynthesis glycosyltransferase